MPLWQQCTDEAGHSTRALVEDGKERGGDFYL